MEKTSQQLPKKRGPAKRLPEQINTHVYMPLDLAEWAKSQPEGLSGLVRALLTAERQRRSGPAT